MNIKNLNKSNPILSISLLSSGRKNTIWKCLDSLIPIMEEISSELIIVDTGCDEETHEEMKKYTDKIIKFEWCNDFSKARNTGLKEAKGEWFLYIDDDEWFSDVTEIIDFFKTQEYKDYGHAAYWQRNYHDKQGVSYKDAWVSRMIKIEKDTRFISSIHEHLYPVRGKVKLLHCPAEHYGYIFTNKKDKYEHSKRNTVLLLKMIKEEPNNLRWRTHLLQEYRGIKEWTKLYETSKEGLSLISEKKDPRSNRARSSFYMGVLLAEMARLNYEDGLEFALNAVKDVRNGIVCNARIYTIISEIYFNLKKYQECEDYCRKYIEIKETCENDEIRMLNEGTFFLYETFDKCIANKVYCFYIGSTLKQNNYEVVRKIIHQIDWEGKSLNLYPTLISDVVEGLAKVEIDDEYISIAQKLMIRKEVRNRTIEKIIEIEKENEEDFKRLTAIFSQVDNAHYYIWYLKIRNIGFGNMQGVEELETYYTEMFKRVNNVLQLKDEVYDIAQQYNINIEKLFLDISFDHWKKGVDFLCKNSSTERILKRKLFIERTCKEENIRWNYFFMQVSNVEICKLTSKSEYDVIYDKLMDFSKKHLEFYHHYYKDTAFEGEMEVLPTTCRLAVKLKYIFEKEQLMPTDMKKCLDECVGVHKEYDTVIKRFVQLYKEKMKEEIELLKQTNNEMEMLGSQIKAKIRYLMESGMLEEAKATLKQLKVFMPNDLEVIELDKSLS